MLHWTKTCLGGHSDFFRVCMKCGRTPGGPCWARYPDVHLCETCAEPYVILDALAQ